METTNDCGYDDRCSVIDVVVVMVVTMTVVVADAVVIMVEWQFYDVVGIVLLLLSLSP